MVSRSLVPLLLWSQSWNVAANVLVGGANHGSRLHNNAGAGVCNFTVDSSDPLHGLIRAGDDISCAPIDGANNGSDTLAGCAAACCGHPDCQSFSWNFPWTLGDHVYMDCVQGKNCCCLKKGLPATEPNK